MVRFLVRLAGVAVALAGPVAASAEPRTGLATGPWKLESLTLVDGRRLHGLVVDPARAGDGSSGPEIGRAHV